MINKVAIVITRIAHVGVAYKKSCTFRGKRSKNKKKRNEQECGTAYRVFHIKKRHMNINKSLLLNLAGKLVRQWGYFLLFFLYSSSSSISHTSYLYRL
jgi:hypothetical protein